MRQEREQPRDKGLGVSEDSNPNIHFDIPGTFPFAMSRELFPFGEQVEGYKLRETRLALLQEDHQDNRVDHLYRKENGQKPDGFEPFVDPQDPLRLPQQEGVLLVNKYIGSFAQKMELNRKAVERVLAMAHLDGQVVLDSFIQSRSRSEAQGDELVAKRFLIFGEKTEKAEEENPYKRVVSTPEGWRVEINDQRITEELAERGLAGEKLQRAFIKRFNGQLKDALKECVWREKCSSAKDNGFKTKFVASIGIPVAHLSYQFNPGNFDTYSFLVGVVSATCFSYSILNVFGRHREKLKRKIDNPLEYILPLVEIDKVIEANAYLVVKRRALVREMQENK